MFTFPPEDKKRKGFFLLPESLVGEEGTNGMFSTKWSRITPSGRAVLFALASHVNTKTYEAYPSEERLGGMCNLTRKTVRKALRELAENDIIKTESYISRNGRRSNNHKWRLPMQGEGLMRFYHTMLDSGIWHELTPSAKSLYLAFRFFGRARPDLDPDFDEDEHNYGAYLGGLDGEPSEEWQEYLQDRTVDFCNADPQILCDFAGITRRRLKEATQSLQKIELIKSHNEEHWQVVIWPSKIWMPDYLNRKLREKGGVT